MSDTTKIIPPPRQGPRWIDLILAAVAGGLVTLLLIGILFTGGLSRFAGASASPSASVSPSPTITIQVRTAAPTTEAPSVAPSHTPTAAPTTAAPTPTRSATPRPTKTP